MLWRAGLRICEALALTEADLDARRGSLLVRRGKGGRRREVAADIRVPTLLVAAERDDVTPIDAQRRLVGLFPDATLEVIPEVGHLIHYETPGDAAARILRFLRSGAHA